MTSRPAVNPVQSFGRASCGWRWPVALQADPLAPRIGTPFQSWRRWFDETAPDLDRQDGAALELPDAALALDAAIQGLGVTLARERLAAPLLRAGILVRLSPDAVEDIYSYWFVRPPTRMSKQIDALLEWLLTQFADDATG